jgi:hypothetical protein
MARLTRYQLRRWRDLWKARPPEPLGSVGGDAPDWSFLQEAHQALGVLLDEISELQFEREQIAKEALHLRRELAEAQETAFRTAGAAQRIASSSCACPCREIANATLENRTV